MKKISHFIFTLLLFTSFFSCSDDLDTENISKTTFFVDLALKGKEIEVIRLNDTYTEEGVTATENGEDVSASVTIDGTVDNTIVGAYNISYTAINKDGFEKTTTRTVVVAPALTSDINLEGTYAGSREGKTHYDNACVITKLSEGVFLASDFFAGHYEKTSGYGSAYAYKVIFILNPDNTYSLIDAQTKPFGDVWELTNTVYSVTDKKLTHRVSTGTFGFNVTLTKN